MKYLGTISNSQDIITKGWLTKNVASVIPDGSITASKLAEDVETSAMVATEVKNPALTKSEDTFTWTISATEHGMMSTALSVIVYDTNGKQVACDISVGNDYGITISIYDNSTATSVSAETYRAVIIGNGSPKTSDVNELVTTELDKKQLRTDLLTLEESENPNTDNMVIPFYDTITGSNKKVALNSVLFGNNTVNASDIQGEISGTQIAEKAININHLESNFILPVEQGGTGAQDAATARTNLEITPANIGALSSANGSITRIKLATDAIGTAVQEWNAQDFPFIVENNGKLLGVWSGGAYIHTITTNILTNLPEGYTITLFRTGASENGPLTIAWTDTEVVDGSTRSWLQNGSIVLKHQGDYIKIVKRGQVLYLTTNISSRVFPEIENNTGQHNSIYRGKNLGSAVTAAQWAAIQAGTFEDLFIGDYWTINGVNWRIAVFDYYLTTTETTHHAVIVPDTSLYTAKMNDTSTTTGGYAGSKMRTKNLATAKTTINNAFGSDHILTYSQGLVNAVSSGLPSGVSTYECTVELMSERQVYGSPIFSGCPWGSSTVPALNTKDRTQFPLFALNPQLASGSWYWLRDIVTDAYFAASNGASSGYAGASYDGGVRPYFCIKA